MGIKSSRCVSNLAGGYQIIPAGCRPIKTVFEAHLWDNHLYHLEDAAYNCYLHGSTIFKMSCFKLGLHLNKYMPVRLFIVFATNKGSLEKPPQIFYPLHASPKTCEFLVLGVFFKYDLSSILVRVNEVHRPFWQFLVRLCGIVGGIFATSGEMNVTLLQYIVFV